MSMTELISLTKGERAINAQRINGKILFVKPPYFTPWTPPLGIAILKTFVEQSGFEARCYDFNIDPELWGMHHKYFGVLQALEDVSINDGYSKLWWILNAHMLAYANGAEPEACATVLDSIIPLYGIRCDHGVINKLLPLVDGFFKRLAELTAGIDLSEYSVVGTSTYTTSLAASLFIHKQVKQQKPSIKTVMGGGIFADDLAHGSSNLDVLVNEYPYIDHVILGEGELLLLKLLQGELANKRVLMLSDLKGVSLEMKSVPIPDFSDLNNDTYYHLTIEGARSCPFQCSFCSETIQWGEYRKKPTDLFVDQIVELSNRYNNKAFFMGDSLMNPYINPFASELIKRGVDIQYDGYMRADKPVTNRKFVKLWADSGLFRVRLGIESAAARVLDSMDKMTTPNVISNVLQTLASEGIRTTTYWIVGFPGETEEDFQETCDFIKQHHQFIYELEAHPYYYYPYGQIGSRLHECRSLYSESVTDVIKFKVWDIIDANPSRAVRYERLRRISKLAADLGLPNIYTMAERYQAEDRWLQLHPLAAEIYEGTRIHREEPHPLKDAGVFDAGGPDSTLCYRISISKVLDEGVLSSTIEQLVRYNEILQARLAGARYVFVSEGEGLRSDAVLSVFLYDGATEDRENFNRQIIKELSAQLTAEKNGSIRIALVHEERAACELFFMAHRAIVDARGLVLLCEDLFRIYEQLLHQKGISLRPSRSYSSVISELEAEDAFYSEQQPAGVNQSEENNSAFSVLFDPGLTERLLDAKSGAFKLKPAEAMAAVLLQTLVQEQATEHFEIDVRADYRNRDENFSQTVGALTKTYKLPVENIQRDDLFSLVKFVRRTLRTLDLQTPDVNGKRVLLNLEYCVENPWLGGIDWTPQGFVENERLATGYDLELKPVVFGDGVRVWFKHRDQPELVQLAEALAKNVAAITEEMLKLRQRYVEMQEFWHKEFARDASQSNLEIDIAAGDASSVFGFERKALAGEYQVTARQIADECNTSVSVVMLTAFSVLLSRLNGHEDVVVVYAGQAENHLEVVPLRLAPSWQRNFNEFVTGVEIKKKRALENGAYAFEFLTADAMQAEDGLTAPSFDVAFIHNQSIDGIVERLTELVPQIGGELKLALELTESAGQLSLNLAYRAGSMQSEIIAQLETWLNSLVSNVARDVGKRIGDIALENDDAVVTVPDDLYGTQFSF